MIQVEFTKTKNRLSQEEIIKAIETNKALLSGYQENEAYYQGNNYAILNQDDKEDGVPDNRIVVPFGRKLAITVKGYLFNGPFGYECDDDEYKSQLDNVLFINKNGKKVQKIGLDLIIHGIGYKIFYNEFINNVLTPRYTIIDQSEGVPIYSIDIEPELAAFIRYFTSTDLVTSVETTKVEVYYADAMLTYDYNTDLIFGKEVDHDFGDVPVVVYGGDYQIGVFDPVKKLIDALDLLVSADLNELQRFEMLYLVLTGDKMTDDADEFAKVMQRRLFEINENATMNFLEKHIDSTFIMALFDRLKDLIHDLSSVPDFMSKDFAAESGIALLYKLMALEQLASDIEKEFIEGEEKSLDLINRILYKDSDYERSTFFKQFPGRQVAVKLPRNLPEDIGKALDDALKMKNLGVTMKTIFQQLPFIGDADEELKNSQEEKTENMKLYQEAAGAIPPKDLPPGQKNTTKPPDNEKVQ